MTPTIPMDSLGFGLARCSRCCIGTPKRPKMTLRSAPSSMARRCPKTFCSGCACTNCPPPSARRKSRPQKSSCLKQSPRLMTVRLTAWASLHPQRCRLGMSAKCRRASLNARLAHATRRRTHQAHRTPLAKRHCPARDYDRPRTAGTARLRPCDDVRLRTLHRAHPQRRRHLVVDNHFRRHDWTGVLLTARLHDPAEDAPAHRGRVLLLRGLLQRRLLPPVGRLPHGSDLLSRVGELHRGAGDWTLDGHHRLHGRAYQPHRVRLLPDHADGAPLYPDPSRSQRRGGHLVL
jgi:hypothetical protein